jgi:voltage-gated potassium channel
MHLRCFRLLTNCIDHLQHVQQDIGVAATGMTEHIEGSAEVLRFEGTNPDANIKTGGDALWYAFVTITTVGYGDRYPITNGGRLAGIALMVCGVGIFSVFTGFIANSFLAPAKKKENMTEIAEPNDHKTKIAEIKAMLEEQQRANSELGDRLDEIEKML